MANEVLLHTSSVSLDWTDVASATKYHLQISSELDFSSIEHEDDTLVSSQDTHTLTGGVGKYYWRWRAYVGSWQTWSEVSSFIYDSTLASTVSASAWKLVNATDASDVYQFELFIKSWKILPEHFMRVMRRNRKGKMLDEWYATKAKITLDISRSYLGQYEKAEVLRFHNMHRSIYLVTRLRNQTDTDYIYYAWEALFTKVPQLDIPGGNTLEWEEV